MSYYELTNNVSWMFVFFELSTFMIETLQKAYPFRFLTFVISLSLVCVWLKVIWSGTVKRLKKTNGIYFANRECCFTVVLFYRIRCLVCYRFSAQVGSILSRIRHHPPVSETARESAGHVQSQLPCVLDIFVYNTFGKCHLPNRARGRYL